MVVDGDGFFLEFELAVEGLESLRAATTITESDVDRLISMSSCFLETDVF